MLASYRGEFVSTRVWYFFFVREFFVKSLAFELSTSEIDSSTLDIDFSTLEIDFSTIVDFSITTLKLFSTLETQFVLNSLILPFCQVDILF